ncbi:unnamed protein product [Fraxinus pennsylvanica]|uniref:UBN2 domain-containing protein n=1 Tax=Fraxinus pennsylvanica TaxID=56036 RepID=A0AAD2E1N6_9LAMI|nr:unnamed protein product [Fraxinus pennsylvanica]
MCETVKEVWDILTTTHEGTKTVKNSKLQMLTTKFEEIRMKDDESFDEFYAKLNDIVNSIFNLDERIPETKIVRKVLRSLSENFRPKVITIEESKNLDTVKIEELVGSLQTYDLTVSQLKRVKSIIMNTIRKEESEYTDTETLKDDKIPYFIKKFQKGYGHYRNEYPNLKMSSNIGICKTLAVTLSDDESNSSARSDTFGEEDNQRLMAFASIATTESDKEI